MNKLLQRQMVRHLGSTGAAPAELQPLLAAISDAYDGFDADRRGIDVKYYEKIFQLFQTLSPRDEKESTGIGLTLVKKIVEFNGGRVWVESKLGEGSTFFFTLPQKTQGELRNERLQTCAAR